jgi:hypothetical protein
MALVDLTFIYILLFFSSVTTVIRRYTSQHAVVACHQPRIKGSDILGVFALQIPLVFTVSDIVLSNVASYNQSGRFSVKA